MSLKDLRKLPDAKLKEALMKFILKDVDVSDDLYQKSFKKPYKVNIDICGLKGYQIYEPNKYTSKMGEHLEDPDLSINIRNMEFVKQLLRGDKVGIENGRDKNYVLQITRKDLFISTDKNNAQVLMAKIPLFDPIVKNFGTSRQAKRLRDDPGPIDPVQEGEIASLMKAMLVETGKMPEEFYPKNFKGKPVKINWDIVGNIAYQHFAENGYKYEFGKHIEDADLTLVIENPDFAKRFLLGLPTNYAPGLDENNNLLIYIKTPVISVKFKNPDETRFSLIKLPFFRALAERKFSKSIEEEKKDDRENYGHYIPINLPLGDYENVPAPYKVLEYFINKASNIVLRTCPCRERWNCKNYPARVRKAIALGLVPLIGRNVAEAEDGHGIADTGKFLAVCFCCECCCIGVKTSQYGAYSSMSGDNSGSIEGMKIKVDIEKCVGCGTCVETCDKVVVDADQCVGCGRCIKVCPQGAISVDIEDPDYIKKFIAKIESIVDVTDQTTKT
ncbi:MAG: DUF362 domain-containing protein [Promethearchaeota archaeon]